jgi:phosphoglycerate dehydrogenase-like enzyme
VGIIGLGGIGGRLAELVRPLGPARILACDPYIAAERAASLGAGVVSREELMRSSDYVVVTCPLTDETRGSIGATELGWMKPSAYFINIARGGIVDEEALVEVLRVRAIAGAATDVFASEPAGSVHPLYELDNIIVAPHSIAWTDEFFERMGVMCCRQAVSLFDGVIPDGLVNVEVLDRPAFTKKLERFKEARRRV